MELNQLYSESLSNLKYCSFEKISRDTYDVMILISINFLKNQDLGIFTKRGRKVEPNILETYTNSSDVYEYNLMVSE